MSENSSKKEEFIYLFILIFLIGSCVQNYMYM